MARFSQEEKLALKSRSVRDFIEVQQESNEHHRCPVQIDGKNTSWNSGPSSSIAINHDRRSDVTLAMNSQGSTNSVPSTRGGRSHAGLADVSDPIRLLTFRLHKNHTQLMLPLVTLIHPGICNRMNYRSCFTDSASVPKRLSFLDRPRPLLLFSIGIRKKNCPDEK